ncbi:tetratricopeptide repeat protein [Halovulum sp. GXIMD14793]
MQRISLLLAATFLALIFYTQPAQAQDETSHASSCYSWDCADPALPDLNAFTCDDGWNGNCAYHIAALIRETNASAFKLTAEYCAKGIGLACEMQQYSIRPQVNAAKDFPSKLNMLKPRCAAGNGLACDEIGLLEYLIDGDVNDRSLAWLNQGCTLGNRYACANLGALKSGRHGGQNQENVAEGIRLMQSACDGHLMQQCSQLGAALSIYHDYLDLNHSAKTFEAGCRTLVASDCQAYANQLLNTAQDRLSVIVAARYYDFACVLQDDVSCLAMASLFDTDGQIGRRPSRVSEYLRKSCDLNNALACSRLAFGHHDGAFGPSDWAVASVFFKRACDLGMARACLVRAMQFKDGIWLQQDYAQDRQLFESSCDLGSAGGCDWLGLMLSGGLGGKRDARRANILFEDACSMGSGHGCWDRVDAYLNQPPPLQNHAAALKWAQRGCKLDSGPSCNALGVILTGQDGVETDLQAATEAYRKGCSLQNGFACSNLGDIYASGKGVTPDLDLAHTLVARGCSLGAGPGCYNLGLSLRDGWTGMINFEQAGEAFRIACHNRVGRAQGSL